MKKNVWLAEQDVMQTQATSCVTTDILIFSALRPFRMSIFLWIRTRSAVVTHSLYPFSHWQSLQPAKFSCALHHASCLWPGRRSRQQSLTYTIKPISSPNDLQQGVYSLSVYKAAESCMSTRTSEKSQMSLQGKSSLSIKYTYFLLSCLFGVTTLCQELTVISIIGPCPFHPHLIYLRKWHLLPA